MTEYRDTQISEDDLTDSIKLKELEPMNSSPYIRITLDEDESNKSSKAPAQRKPGNERAEYEARRRAEAQKKARRKQERESEASKRNRPQANTRPDPALRVIIEHAAEPDPYSYDGGYEERDYAGNQYARNAQPQPYAVDPYGQYGAPVTPLEQFAAQFPTIPNNVIYGSAMPVMPGVAPQTAIPQAAVPQATVPREIPVQYPVQETPADYYVNNQVGADYRASSQTEPINAAAVAGAVANGVYNPAGQPANAFSGEPVNAQPAQADATAARPQTIKPLTPSITLDADTISTGLDSSTSPKESVIVDSETNSKIVKRPWNSSALAEHSAAANEVGSSNKSTVSTKGSFEVRPFTDLSRTDSGTHSQSHRGMGSWKATALGAQPYNQTSNESGSSAGTSDGESHGIRFNISDEGHIAESGNFKLDQKTMDDFGIGPTRDEPSTFDQIGSPLLDEAALEESTMFEEPPVSLAEGMKNADHSHKRRRHGVVVGVLVGVIALLIAFICFLLFATDYIDLDGILSGSGTSQSNTSSGTAQSSAHSSNASSGSGGNANSNASSGSSGSTADLSGTVVYEYTAFTSNNVEYKVHETVTFGSNGECQSTEMQLEFPDEEAAAAFLSNLSRDYGSAYTLDSSNGADATVTINISSLKLDREEYEDALRYSVEDLVILKK